MTKQERDGTELACASRPRGRVDAVAQLLCGLENTRTRLLTDPDFLRSAVQDNTGRADRNAGGCRDLTSRNSFCQRQWIDLLSKSGTPFFVS